MSKTNTPRRAAAKASARRPAKSAKAATAKTARPAKKAASAKKGAGAKAVKAVAKAAPVKKAAAKPAPKATAKAAEKPAPKKKVAASTKGAAVPASPATAPAASSSASNAATAPAAAAAVPVTPKPKPVTLAQAGADTRPTAAKKVVPPEAAPKPVEPVKAEAPKAPARPTAVLKTTFGDIALEFWPEKAPRHVENFFKLAERGSYDNLLFHRVIPNFMIQTGCPKGDGTGGPGWKVNAEFNDARFVKGVVGMARGAHRDSAGSQFFICVADAPHLNGSYTAFGKVTVGQEVVDRIAVAPRDRRDRPLEDIRLVEVSVPRAEG